MIEVKSPIVGVARDDFSEEVWRGIAEAYVRSAYREDDDQPLDESRWLYVRAADVLNGYGSHRIGSVISFNSRIVICSAGRGNMHFNFDPNADEHELQTARTMLDIEPALIDADFNKRVSAHLSELGVAREIVDCNIHPVAK